MEQTGASAVHGSSALKIAERLLSKAGTEKWSSCGRDLPDLVYGSVDQKHDRKLPQAE